MSQNNATPATIKVGDIPIYTAVFVNGIPTPSPTPPTPTPNPPPVSGNLDLTGCQMIFPSNPAPKAQAFYVDVTKEPTTDNYACTYGSDIVKFQPMKEGNVVFLRSPCHAQTYASGQPPGKSFRGHINPAGGMFDNSAKYCWKDTPTPVYLYKENVFYSFEQTIIFRPGPALGTHQSCAFKMCSIPDGKDDTRRSTIEFCFPNDQKSDCYVNYNYAHATYAKVPSVIQHSDKGKVTVGKWIGLKVMFIIAADRKSTWIGGYVNEDPVDTTTGKIKNDGWIFKAEYLAKGIPEYNNVPPVWGGQTNYNRIDGYDHIDLLHHSQREILDSSALHTNNVAKLDLKKSRIAAVPTDNFADYDP